MAEKKNSEKKVATALKYNPSEDAAPHVVAKGRGVIAEKIAEKAEESDIAIYKDEKLARQLYNLSIGEEIPPELYNVIAEVLMFISDLDRKR